MSGAAAGSGPEEESGWPSRPFCILIVDDEADIRESLQTFLAGELENTDVLVAEGAEGALEHLKQRPIDVVLSDHKMPGMTGLDLLLEVKRQMPTAVRVLMTAYPDMQVATRAINEGEVDRFFTKPLDPDEIADGLRALLEAKRAEQMRRMAFLRSLDEMRKRLGKKGTAAQDEDGS